MSIPSWAKVGAKVVCVRPHASPDLIDGETGVVRGKIYTIRGVVEWPGYGVGLFLVELVNPPVVTAVGTIERANHLYRFRPLVSTKTQTDDMAEHFDKLLTTDPIVRLDMLLEALDQ